MAIVVISDLLQVAVAAASAVVTAAVPIVVPKALAWLHVSKESRLNADLTAAAERGAALGLQRITDRIAKGEPITVNVRNDAVRVGLEYVTAGMQQKMEALALPLSQRPNLMLLFWWVGIS